VCIVCFVNGDGLQEVSSGSEGGLNNLGGSDHNSPVCIVCFVNGDGLQLVSCWTRAEDREGWTNGGGSHHRPPACIVCLVNGDGLQLVNCGEREDGRMEAALTTIPLCALFVL
jgi:hypothetical protein